MDRCVICDRQEHIQKHHTSYFPERIILLCRGCHRLVHKLIDSYFTSVQIIEIAFLVQEHVNNKWRVLRLLDKLDNKDLVELSEFIAKRKQK